MIKTFRDKGLGAFWAGKRSRIDARFHKRLRLRLDRLHAASTAEDMNLPGDDFHRLTGFIPKRYTVHVNGPWCITFAFENGDACQVDFEQYH